MSYVVDIFLRPIVVLTPNGQFLSCANTEFSERYIENVTSQDAKDNVCTKDGRIDRGLEMTPQLQLHNLYYSPNVIRIIIFRRTNSAQNVEIIRKKKRYLLLANSRRK